MIQKNLGGQLNIFQTSLPTVGPGALKHREDPKLYGTDKEKTLFTVQDPFYRVSAEECVEAGIGINLFLFPSQYIDAATLGRHFSLLSHMIQQLTKGDPHRCIAGIDWRRFVLPPSIRPSSRRQAVTGRDWSSSQAGDSLQCHDANQMLEW